ncbi:MAG: ATP-dependent Clp protease proteolytic subunit, partial [Candidatus Paceibacterota bacterium]
LFAASMGSAVVEALPGERLILDSGILMFHRAKGQVGGQFETGELESRLAFYKSYVRRMERRNADRMYMTLKEYKKKIKDELWLSSTEAVESKAADRVVSLQCSEALIEKTEHSSVVVFIFKVELTFSACPLLRTPSVADGQSAEAVDAYQKYKSINDLRKVGGAL